MRKLYALIDKNMERAQKAVQAGHAVSKYASRHPEINWDKQTFVYLDATQFQIKKTQFELDNMGVEYDIFIDDEIHGDIITSIVCIPPDTKEFSKMYKKYNTMKG